jgi:flagellar hook-associated protein 3 FlgL
MPVRVSQNAQYAVITARLRENLLRLHSTQLDLATGLKIRTPSDDPAGAARLLSIERIRVAYDRYAENANLVAATLGRATTELESGGEILGEVRARIVEALNGTLSESDRASLADDVDGAADRLILVANAGAEGRFLFGGSRTGAPPFKRYAGKDGVERVRYFGDDLRPRVEVAPGLKEIAGLPGSTAFGAGVAARGGTVYSGGGTGVVAAAGLSKPPTSEPPLRARRRTRAPASPSRRRARPATRSSATDTSFR